MNLLLTFRVQKRRLSATKLPTPPERRKSSIVHADLKAVAIEVNGGGDNGRRKESRSGSLPDIQVGENTYECEICFGRIGFVDLPQNTNALVTLLLKLW